MSRVWAALLLAAVGLAVAASDALASGTVTSGASDAVSSLVISPSSGAVTGDVAAGNSIAFIQNMPVTKTATSIVVGNFAKSANCPQGSGDPQAYLGVRDYPSGDLLSTWGGAQTYNPLVNSTNTIDVTSSTTRLAFRIPPTTFVQGHGYGFVVGVNGGCSTLSQTTWAHNSGQVNPGPEHCSQAPFYPTSAFRQWHDVGVDDHSPCANTTTFQASMPSGWLTIATSNGSDFVVRRGNNGPTVDCYGQAPSYPYLGAQELAWPAGGMNVCYYPQFAPAGQTVADGWYYSYPWGGDYLPRDMYLRIGSEPATAGELAGKTLQANSDEFQKGTLPVFGSPDDALGVHVNPANGNLTVGAQDLDIAGTGMPLTFQRFYNSLQGTSSDLGFGWSSNQDQVRLQISTAGTTATFFGPSGFVVNFTSSGGTWAAPPGVDDALVTNGDGSYKLSVNATGETYNFTSSGQLSSHADKDGNRISYGYTSGNLSSITDTQGRQVTVTTSGGQITKLTDSTGRSVSYAYDANGNLQTFTDANLGQTVYAYDSQGRMTQITDPNGNVTKIAYAGATASVASILDVTNNTTGAGDTTSYSYTPSPTSGTCNGYGSQTNITDPNNNTTTYCYDAHGREALVQDPLGHQTTQAYNTDGQLTSVTLPSGAATTYGYDANNNKTSEQQPTGATTTWRYDDTAHPFYATKETDPQGNTTTHAYNAAGDLVTVTDAANKQIVIGRNGNGTIASVRDRNGNTTSYGYDNAGNLTSTTPPVPLAPTSQIPDSLSRVSTSTDGAGNQTAYTYDPLDRVTKTVTGSNTLTYKYDNNGNQTQSTDPTGTTTSVYDAKNRLTSQTLPGQTTPTTYAYDGADRLTSLTDGGGVVQYGYDTANELTSLTEPGGARTTFGYDANGSRTSTAYPNGVTLSQTYAADSAGHATDRLKTISSTNTTGTTLASFTYDYSKAGSDTSLRQAVTDQLSNKTAYSYDALDRLTDAKTTNAAGAQTADYQYGYDPAGNITGQNKNGVATTYTYNAANELSTSSALTGTTTYNYDANGNQTSDSGNSLAFAYNPLNQTTSITPATGGAITFSYRGAGQTHRASAGSTTFTDNTLGLSSSTTAGSSTYFTRDNTGRLVSERTTTGTSYYIFDGLGSVVGLTNSIGLLTDSYAYEPYGAATTTTGSTSNPWRFAGEYLDTSTGLYKIGARYYNPTLGRWSQQDPLVQPTSVADANRYAYAGDDPVNRSDPTGLKGYLDYVRDFANYCTRHPWRYYHDMNFYKGCEYAYHRLRGPKVYQPGTRRALGVDCGKGALEGGGIGAIGGNPFTVGLGTVSGCLFGLIG